MSALNEILEALHEFGRDRAGGVFVFVAFSFLILIGAAALAVDFGNAYALQARLQNAADASALAAARELPDANQVSVRAQEYATKNMGTRYGQVVGANGVAVGNWDVNNRVFAASASPINAVEVTARMAQENGNPAPTFFGRIFGFDTMDISARAVATGGSSRCVYVLDLVQRGALKVSGTSIIELDCGVAVNSRDSWGIQQIGAGSCMNAPSIEVVGGYTINCTSTPPVSGVAPFNDPLANLAPPDWWECDFNSVSVNGTATISPGTYCGQGLKINSGAYVTMEPGEYIFWGVPFSVSGGATVSGNDVTIYFTEGGGAKGVLSISGGANVTLTAPTTGPFTSVVFYSDRNATQNVTHKFTGGTTMDLTGIIYAPNQNLQFSGGADMTGSCVTIVARELEFVGNTNITASNSCPEELSDVMSDLRLVQ